MPPAAQAGAVLATVAAWIVSRRLARAAGGHPLASPVLVSALAIACLLPLLGLPAQGFAAAAAPLSWWLGPGVVALGVPLAALARSPGRRELCQLLAILGGSLAGVASAVCFAHLLALPPDLRAASATRSVTSGVAAVVMQALGGPVALAVALSVVSGLIGALVLPPLLSRLGIRSDRALGTATGLAAHVLGTEALARRQPGAVPHATLAMAAGGLLTALGLVLAARLGLV